MRKLRRVADKDRKRVDRACDSCRKKKEKCDGGLPCRQCFRLRRQCVFSSEVSGRQSTNVTPPSRLVEEQPSELFQRVTYLEQIVKRVFGDINLDLETLRGLAEAEDNHEPSSAPTEVSIQQNEPAAVDIRCSIEPLENNITHYSGEFSHWNFSMQIKKWIDRHVPREHVHDAMRGRTEFYRSKELQCPSSASVSISLLPPRPVADFLVHCFFKHADMNYFTVEKTWLTSSLNMAYTNPTSLDRNNVATMCLVFSVLAIGTQYVHLESATERSDNRKAYKHGQFTGDTVGVMFYHQACLLLPDVITLSSLESVQACLLLGIYTLPLDASGLAWIYLGIGVKLAVQNGMHRKCTVNSLDPFICETRNRVWWSLYTLERRVAIFHGRPMSIAQSEIDAELPVDRDDIWSSTHTACTLATLQLNDMLGAISQSVSSLRASPKSQVTERLHRLSELQNDLVNWWNTIPNEVISKDPVSQPHKLRRRIQLKLEYCLVRLFAGRCFIFSEPWSQNNNPNSSTDSSNAAPSPNDSQRSQLSPHLVLDCITAAQTIVETIQYLHNTIGLARSSYTEFSACRAALLVITTQCLQTKEYHYRHTLRVGLAMLKEMTGGAELARSEASLIEAFQRIIARMDTVSDDVNTGTDSGFLQFKKWESLWKQDPPLMGLPGSEDSMAMASPGRSDWSYGALYNEIPLWASLFGPDQDAFCM